jgi:dTDP-4-dehydrorhamnose 3,5-epimerase
MKFIDTPFQGLYIIETNPFSDNRGKFSRLFCKKEFEAISHDFELLQVNYSQTWKKNTIRGMHYQRPPKSEIKIIKCIRGKIFDVVVDIRRRSDTFLQWFSIELSAENKKMIYIPQGFAHGFQTLSADCEILYFHSELYAPGFEGGLSYDDPALKIEWPLISPFVSSRDKSHPLINNNFKGI